VTETHHHIELLVGGDIILAPLLKIIDGMGQNFFGRAHGIFFFKLNMNGIGHLSPIIGGNNIGVLVFYHLGHGLHNTLHINHHGLDCAGGQHHLLLNETAGHGNSAPHQDFVAGTANPGQINSFCSNFFGKGQNLRILGGKTKGLGKQGLVPMHGHIDLIFPQYPKINNGTPGNRGSKHDIGELGGKHGRSPAIGQGASGPLQHDIMIFLIHTHVGSMHGLNNLTINAAWLHTQFFPDCLLFFRRPLDHGEQTVLLTELSQGLGPQFKGDLVLVPSLDGNAEDLSHGMELLHIFNLVRRFTLGSGDKAAHHLPRMIRVSRSSSRDYTGKIPGSDGISSCPADTDHGLHPINNLAGPHITDLAAGAARAK